MRGLLLLPPQPTTALFGTAFSAFAMDFEQDKQNNSAKHPATQA